MQRVHGMELYRGSWTGKVGRASQVRIGEESLGGSD